MFVHVRSQQGVYLSLVTGTPGPEPLEDIGVETQRDLLLRRHRLEIHTHDGLCEGLGRPFGIIRKVNVFITRGIDTFPVSF
jgi:hypothetical protein